MSVREDEIKRIPANYGDGREREVIGDVAFVEDLFAGPFVYTGRAGADSSELWCGIAGF